MTVGLPRAGKTTWARQQNHPIIEMDALWVLLGHDGNPRPVTGNDALVVDNIAKTMVKALFLSGNRTVILCGTHLLMMERENWISSGWKRNFKVFDTSYEVCKTRTLETCGEKWLADFEGKAAMAEVLLEEELREDEIII